MNTTMNATTNKHTPHEFNPYLTMWIHGVLNMDLKSIPLSVVLAPLLSEQLPPEQRWDTRRLANFVKTTTKHSKNYRYKWVMIDEIPKTLHDILSDERLGGEFIHPVELHFLSFLYVWKRYEQFFRQGDMDLLYSEIGYGICEEMTRYETFVSCLIRKFTKDTPKIDPVKFLPLALKRVRTFNLNHVDEVITKQLNQIYQSYQQVNSTDDIWDVFMPALFKNSIDGIEYRFPDWHEVTDPQLLQSIKLPDYDIISVAYVDETNENNENKDNNENNTKRARNYMVREYETLSDFPDPSLVCSLVECGFCYSLYLPLEKCNEFFKLIHFTVYNNIVNEVSTQFQDGLFKDMTNMPDFDTNNDAVDCDVQNLAQFVNMNDQADLHWSIARPNLQKFGNILNRNPHLFNKWFIIDKVENESENESNNPYAEYATLTIRDLVNPEYLIRYESDIYMASCKDPYKGCIMDEKDIIPYLTEVQQRGNDMHRRNVRSTHPYWPIHDSTRNKTFWLIAHERKGRFYVDGSTLPIPIRTRGYIDLVNALDLVSEFIQWNYHHPPLEWRGKYNNLYRDYWRAVFYMASKRDHVHDRYVNRIMEDFRVRRQHTLKGDWESDDRYPPATNKLVHFTEIVSRSMVEDLYGPRSLFLNEGEELFSDDEEDTNYWKTVTDDYEEHDQLFVTDEDRDGESD